MALIGLPHLLSIMLLSADVAAGPELRVTDEQRAALGIETAPVRAVEDVAVGVLPGRVLIPPSAQRVVTIPFDGVIIDVFVNEGERVAAGAPLLRLRSGSAALAHAEAKRLLALAEVARAQAARDAKLVAEGIAPTRRAEESAAQARAAEAAAAAAQAVFRSGRAVVARPDEFDIVAPEAGVVHERGLASGAEAKADTVALAIVTRPERWVEAQAPESLLGSLRIGARVELNGSLEYAPGCVIAVGNRIEATTRNALVRASFANAPALFAGRTVELKVFERVDEPTFEVPANAVVRQGTRDVVFASIAGGFRSVPVRTSVRLEGRVAVQGALSKNDRVAVSGTSALKSLAQE